MPVISAEPRRVRVPSRPPKSSKALLIRAFFMQAISHVFRLHFVFRVSEVVLQGLHGKCEIQGGGAQCGEEPLHLQ